AAAGAAGAGPAVSRRVPAAAPHAAAGEAGRGGGGRRARAGGVRRRNALPGPRKVRAAPDGPRRDRRAEVSRRARGVRGGRAGRRRPEGPRRHRRVARPARPGAYEAARRARRVDVRLRADDRGDPVPPRCPHAAARIGQVLYRRTEGLDYAELRQRGRLRRVDAPPGPPHPDAAGPGRRGRRVRAPLGCRRVQRPVPLVAAARRHRVEGVRLRGIDRRTPGDGGGVCRGGAGGVAGRNGAVARELSTRPSCAGGERKGRLRRGREEPAPRGRGRVSRAVRRDAVDRLGHRPPRPRAVRRIARRDRQGDRRRPGHPAGRLPPDQRVPRHRRRGTGARQRQAVRRDAGRRRRQPAQHGAGARSARARRRGGRGVPPGARRRQGLGAQPVGAGTGRAGGQEGGSRGAVRALGGDAAAVRGGRGRVGGGRRGGRPARADRRVRRQARRGRGERVLLGPAEDGARGIRRRRTRAAPGPGRGEQRGGQGVAPGAVPVDDATRRKGGRGLPGGARPRGGVCGARVADDRRGGDGGVVARAGRGPAGGRAGGLPDALSRRHRPRGRGRLPGRRGRVRAGGRGGRGRGAARRAAERAGVRPLQARAGAVGARGVPAGRQDVCAARLALCRRRGRGRAGEARRHSARHRPRGPGTAPLGRRGEVAPERLRGGGRRVSRVPRDGRRRVVCRRPARPQPRSGRPRGRSAAPRRALPAGARRELLPPARARRRGGRAGGDGGVRAVRQGGLRPGGPVHRRGPRAAPGVRRLRPVPCRAPTPPRPRHVARHHRTRSRRHRCRRRPARRCPASGV
ncbi:MAG: hypothetical protein AVDCRST_MAG64-474, partial [uncultured Phycisphaerae bacterium]